MSIFQLGEDEAKKLEKESPVAEKASSSVKASGTVTPNEKSESRKATKSSRSEQKNDDYGERERRRSGFAWPVGEETAENIKTVDDLIHETQDPIAEDTAAPVRVATTKRKKQDQGLCDQKGNQSNVRNECLAGELLMIDSNVALFLQCCCKTKARNIAVVLLNLPPKNVGG